MTIKSTAGQNTSELGSWGKNDFTIGSGIPSSRSPFTVSESYSPIFSGQTLLQAEGIR